MKEAYLVSMFAAFTLALVAGVVILMVSLLSPAQAAQNSNPVGMPIGSACGGNVDMEELCEEGITGGSDPVKR